MNSSTSLPLTVLSLTRDSNIIASLGRKYQNTQIYVTDLATLKVSHPNKQGKLIINGVEAWGTDTSPIQGKISPDVIVLDTMSQPVQKRDLLYGQCLTLLEKIKGNPCILVTPFSATESSDLVEMFYRRPLTDFVFYGDDTQETAEELHFRIRRILELHIVQTGSQEQITREAKPDNNVLNTFVAELRHPDSGRLDIKKVSSFLGVTVSEMARWFKRDVSTVSKTPDAESLQEGLRVYERIIAMLLFLVNDPVQVRMWLNAPNPSFDNEPPLSFCQEGLAEVVMLRIQNHLTGQPA